MSITHTKVQKTQQTPYVTASGTWQPTRNNSALHHSAQSRYSDPNLKNNFQKHRKKATLIALTTKKKPQNHPKTCSTKRKGKKVILSFEVSSCCLVHSTVVITTI
jgi:hypothetical protein